MADATMLASRQVRLATAAALAGPAFAGVNVYSPGDWTTPQTRLPAILFRVAANTKESINKGQPEFNSTVTIEIEARVSANTAEAAQDGIEALGYTIEQALLTNHDLLAIVTEVSSFNVQTAFSAEGGVHLAGMKMSVDFSLAEMFDPFVNVSPPALQSIGIHMDAINPFDANGTYTGTLFPSSVQPAPRTSGPDGRDEGALDITLPQ